MIFTPKATKLRSDRVQLDSFLLNGNSGNRTTYLGVGLGESFDFELVDNQKPGLSHRFSLDFSYNFLSPIADLAPGISFGVQDLLDRSDLGSGFYGAITWRLNNVDPINAATPVEFTIGAGTGRFRGAFVNARFPISNAVRIITEHDSREVSGGIELMPNSSVRLRYTVRGDENFTSFSLSLKF